VYLLTCLLFSDLFLEICYNMLGHMASFQAILASGGIAVGTVITLQLGRPPKPLSVTCYISGMRGALSMTAHLSATKFLPSVRRPPDVVKATHAFVTETGASDLYVHVVADRHVEIVACVQYISSKFVPPWVRLARLSLFGIGR
jgi:hypothetical protein